MHKLLLISFLSCFFIQDDPTILWNDNEKVNWNDFKGDPKPQYDEIAVTASGLSFHYSTTRYSSGRIDYDFDVTAHFYPEKSWYVKEDVTGITLAHERLHFDITELHARKFRQRVRNFEFTDNIDFEMNAINKLVNEDLRAMQKLYDAETKHSRDEKKQFYWQDYVAKALNEMIRHKN